MYQPVVEGNLNMRWELLNSQIFIELDLKQM